MESMLQISAAAIRGYRNTLQPVNRLPPEVLVIIFKKIQQHLPSFVPLPDRKRYDDHYVDWLVTIHVCRHWRGIAATYSHLWSTIDSHLIPRTFLKRSGHSPLTLYLGVRKPGVTQSLIEALAPQSDRFQEFHVAVDTVWDGATPMYSLLNHPAPQLSSLTIINNGWDGINALPPIFAGHMPNLRQVTLGYFTSWPTGCFGQLTHLCLYHQCRFTRPSTSQFLDYLDACPELVEMVLVDAGPTRDDVADFPVTPAARSVSLCHLRGLHLGDWEQGHWIGRFLSHLTLPETTILHIWGDSLRNHDNLGFLFPADVSHLDNINTVTEWSVNRLEVSDSYVPTVIVERAHLSIEGPFTFEQIVGLSLGNVQTVDIREPENPLEQLSSDAWMYIFQKLPSLTSLEIYVDFIGCYSITSTILSALDPRKLKGQDEASSDAVLCRDLEKLIINDDPHLSSLYIMAVVEERARRGSHLKALDITERQRDQDGHGLSDHFREQCSSGNVGQTFTSRDIAALKACMKDVEVTLEACPRYVSPRPAEWPTRFARWDRSIQRRRQV